MNTFRLYIFVSFFALLFNFAWEYTALPLYTDYAALGSGPPLVLWASCFDVVYVLGIVGAVALWKGKKDWMVQGTAHEYFLAVFLGFLVALFVEYKALYFHRWGYAAAMPIIPILNVGLTPIIQMTVFAPLSALLAGLAERRFLVYSKNESL